MASRKYDDKMKLEMPPDEALERFIGTSPDELEANIRRSKKKKPSGGKSKPKPSDDNVASLTQRRVRKRNTGR